MVDGVSFNLVANFASVSQSFGQIREHLVHLSPCFKPLLLGVEHTLRVVQVFTRSQTNQSVVSFGIFFVHKVTVVGTNTLYIVFCSHAQQLLVHRLLFGISVTIGSDGWVCHLVTHQLNVIVVAKDAFKPLHRFFSLFNASLHNFLGNFSTQTGRTNNEIFVKLLQILMVSTRTHIKTIHPCTRHKFHQIMVTMFVFCQHN